MDTKGGVTIPWHLAHGEEVTMLRNAWGQAKILAGWEGLVDDVLTHIYVGIYTYIYIPCLCMCVCVRNASV